METTKSNCIDKLQQVHDEKKKRKKLAAIMDPEGAAAKKLKRAVKRSESRKRRIERFKAFRGHESSKMLRKI